MKSTMMVVATLLLAATSLAQENQQQVGAPLEGDLQAQPNIINWWPGRPNGGIPPWWSPFAAERRDERQVAEGPQDEPNEDLPEASNYAVSAEPYICCVVCIRCHGRKARDSMPAIQATGNAPAPFEILGSAIEMKLYNTLQDIIGLYKSPVSRAELYERPLDPATSPSVAQALGYKQSAVVVTLRDGRRFMLVKGNNKGEGRQTVIILAYHMTDDWVKVQTKPITRSVLVDFARAGGLSFDALHDNGKDAAMRMMALE